VPKLKNKDQLTFFVICSANKLKADKSYFFIFLEKMLFRPQAFHRVFYRCFDWLVTFKFIIKLWWLPDGDSSQHVFY